MRLQINQAAMTIQKMYPTRLLPANIAALHRGTIGIRPVTKARTVEIP